MYTDKWIGFYRNCGAVYSANNTGDYIIAKNIDKDERLMFDRLPDSFVFIGAKYEDIKHG